MKFHLRSILPKLPQLKTLFYDCEILNPIRCSDDWRDFEYLGLSVVGCFADWLPENQQWQAFTADDGFAGIQSLIDEADRIVGFNSCQFDDRLCEAHGIRIKTTFDLMQQVRRAAGEPVTGRCTSGYNLLRLAKSNLGEELPQVLLRGGSVPSRVPDLWLAGEKEAVIKYCLNDVFLTRELFNRRTNLVDPVRQKRRLHCDPDLTDWQEIKATLGYYFVERVGSIQVRRQYHWTDATILEIRVALAETIRLQFPVWIFPESKWQDYVGLPFERTSAYNAKTDRQKELDLIHNPDRDDPIPF